MKLHTLPNGTTIALDALIELGAIYRPVSSSGLQIWSDAVCEGTFALHEKPIVITLAVYPVKYSDSPSVEKRKEKSLLSRAAKERAKIVNLWKETQLKS